MREGWSSPQKAIEDAQGGGGVDDGDDDRFSGSHRLPSDLVDRPCEGERLKKKVEEYSQT